MIEGGHCGWFLRSGGRFRYGSILGFRAEQFVQSRYLVFHSLGVRRSGGQSQVALVAVEGQSQVCIAAGSLEEDSGIEMRRSVGGIGQYAVGEVLHRQEGIFFGGGDQAQRIIGFGVLGVQDDDIAEGACGQVAALDGEESIADFFPGRFKVHVFFQIEVVGKRVDSDLVIFAVEVEAAQVVVEGIHVRIDGGCLLVSVEGFILASGGMESYAQIVPCQRVIGHILDGALHFFDRFARLAFIEELLSLQEGFGAGRSAAGQETYPDNGQNREQCIFDPNAHSSILTLLFKTSILNSLFRAERLAFPDACLTIALTERAHWVELYRF